jgi:predicted nucleic-acid-binding protein
MRVTLDTNVLLRTFVDDDPQQAKAALEAIEAAEVIAISLQALCEFVWVLLRHYETSRADIGLALRHLLQTRKVSLNRPAVEAGLAVLDAGGDFADGVIAFEGDWLGGEMFVTFDKKASRILESQGRPTRLLRGLA